MTTSAHRRHLTIHLDKLNRSKNRSFASGAAYILRTTIHEPRLAVTHRHHHKAGLLGSGMKGWAGDVGSLCQAASAAERRADSVEGRSLILALPHELSKESGLRLLATLASFLYERHQVASVFALHAPDEEGDQRNCHGHMVFTSRRVNPEGTQLGEKTREWDVATGSGHTEALREFWTATLNAELETIGAEADVEHRSFERLGIDRMPGTHRGVAKTARMRREAQRRPLVLPLPTPVVAAPAPAPVISMPSALESTGRLIGRPLPCPMPSVPREPDPVAARAAVPLVRLRPLPVPKIPSPIVEPSR